MLLSVIVISPDEGFGYNKKEDNFSIMASSTDADCSAASVVKIFTGDQGVHVIPHLALICQLYFLLDVSPEIFTDLGGPVRKILFVHVAAVAFLYCTCH